MNKPTLKLLVILIMALMANGVVRADEAADYRKFAEEIKSWVYSMDLPAFSVREIPEKYKNESAVFVAIYDDLAIIRDTETARLPGTLRFSSDKHIEGGNLERKLIYINDKAALDEFSEYDYRTSLTKKYPSGRKKYRQVLGVKVIKPDGTEREVDTDDYIEVRDGKDGKDMRQKLAVPGLEVGDMIDMFVYVSHDLHNAHPDPVAFVLREDYPVMDYTLHCLIDGSLSSSYRLLNDIPDFKGFRDYAGNFRLDMNMTDVPARPRFFYDDMLQSPMVKLFVFNRDADGFVPKSSAAIGLLPNPGVDGFKTELLNALRDPYFKESGKEKLMGSIKSVGKIQRRLSQALKSGEKSLVDVADCAYNLLAFSYLMADGSPSSLLFDVQLESLLRDLVGDSLMTVITTDDDVELLDRAASIYSLATGCALPGGERYYFEPRAIMAPSELHPGYAARLAQQYTDKEIRSLAFHGDTVYFTLPDARAIKNRKYCALTVDIDGTDLNVNRQTICTGSSKIPVMGLLSEEDITNAYLDYFNSWGIDVGLKGGGKKIKERLARYADDKIGQVNDFKREAKAHHSEGVIDSVRGRVVAVGIDPHAPKLIYESDYVISELVKKAGKNKLIAIGRLTEGFRDILDSDRQRDERDIVVIGYPREYITKIVVNLPDGARVSEKSIETLNRMVNNSAGMFAVSSRVEDGKLVADVMLRFDRRFLTSDRWPDVVELLEASSEWQGVNVLVEN